MSIDAPGQITVPDPDVPGWRGVAAVERRFGAAFDPAAAARVPVQVVVGALDDDPDAAAVVAADRDRIGRLTQARTLADALRGPGSSVRLDVVEGVGHDGAAVTSAVAGFRRPRPTTRREKHRP